MRVHDPCYTVTELAEPVAARIIIQNLLVTGAPYIRSVLCDR